MANAHFLMDLYICKGECMCVPKNILFDCWNLPSGWLNLIIFRINATCYSFSFLRSWKKNVFPVANALVDPFGWPFFSYYNMCVVLYVIFCFVFGWMHIHGQTKWWWGGKVGQFGWHNSLINKEMMFWVAARARVRPTNFGIIYAQSVY
jgi:hypothetical protein